MRQSRAPMPRNVEIKAILRDRPSLETRAASLADGPRQILRQVDTFYEVASGRLKLREFEDGTGELIAYHRSDAPGPSTSHYVRSPTTDAASLRGVLNRALQIRGTVTKTRLVLLAGRTRIHLDRVEDLGDFMELEVMLSDDGTEAEARAEADDLLQRLGIPAQDRVHGAYIDLLESS